MGMRRVVLLIAIANLLLILLLIIPNIEQILEGSTFQKMEFSFFFLTAVLLMFLSLFAIVDEKEIESGDEEREIEKHRFYGSTHAFRITLENMMTDIVSVTSKAQELAKNERIEIPVQESIAKNVEGLLRARLGKDYRVYLLENIIYIEKTN
jgi:hypothetical protein